MMVGKLSFKNLPFVPEKGEVIYVESSYHRWLNSFIRNNYDWLKNTFSQHQLHFCYLPLRAKEVVNYYAPYLTTVELQARIGRVPSLSDYLVGDADIKPSLVFALETPQTEIPCDIVLQSVNIDTQWQFPQPTRRTFTRLANQIEQAINDHRSHTIEEGTSDRIRFSFQTHFSIGTPRERRAMPSFVDPDLADENFDFESQQLIDEIRERVEALRNKGFNTTFIHDIIDESEHLSRLRITKDYRIYLVDYQNMEIKLPVLPKAVFFLFLHHPEGIRFKELTDYYSELLQIYLKMNPIGGRTKQEQSIRDVTNPCNNSINEKCARIREAFVQNFDDRLAKNYYITGKRGEPKRIVLDQSMIIWE